ncbi:hypothetical protein [Bifidobacterium aquikefiricola]|uniref:Uncharacterized protein n=1 Tax=Bifidobacterium aquikefiricola TaxID=3059038 RepID=A0AB39U6I3_9BIFI
MAYEQDGTVESGASQERQYAYSEVGPEYEPEPPRSRGASVLSAIAAILGLIAVILSVFFITRTIAPASLKFSDSLSMPILEAGSFVFSVLALIFVIAAKISHRRARQGGRKGTWGIIAIVLALLITVCGLLIGNLFPQGVIQPKVSENAPVSSSKTMRKGIESSVGTCTGGWESLGTSSYPGLSLAELCKEPRMAYVTFENPTMASFERGAVNSKISDMLEEHSNNSEAQGDWRTLNGKTWLVFGEKANIEKLQKSWGGTIDTIE